MRVETEITAVTTNEWPEGATRSAVIRPVGETAGSFGFNHIHLNACDEVKFRVGQKVIIEVVEPGTSPIASSRHAE